MKYARLPLALVLLALSGGCASRLGPEAVTAETAEPPAPPPEPAAEAVVVDGQLEQPDEANGERLNLEFAQVRPKPTAQGSVPPVAGASAGADPAPAVLDTLSGDATATKAPKTDAPDFKAEPADDEVPAARVSTEPAAAGAEDVRATTTVQTSKDANRRASRPKKKARKLNRSARRNREEVEAVTERQSTERRTGRRTERKRGQRAPATPKVQIPLGAVGSFGKATLSAGDAGRGPRLLMDRDAQQDVLPKSSTWNVRVEGGLARIEAEYVFESAQGAGRVVFSHPLPADAVVVDMAVWDGADRPEAPKNKLGNLQEHTRSGAGRWVARSHAQVLARKQAHKVFRDSLPLQDGAALLAVGNGPSFKIDISRIVAGRPMKVLFVWQLPLTPSAQGPVLQLSVPAEGVETKLTAHVDVGADDVSAPGWQATGSGPQWCEFKASASAGSQLRIGFKGDATRFGPAESGLEGRAFVARISPRLGAKEVSPTGKAIFVVDTSRSGAHPAAAALRAQMLKTLLKDSSLESYAVLLFDVHARWLHGPSWRNPSADNVQDTLTQLSRVELEGATDLDVAFAALNAPWIRDAGPSRVFFLSDANATWGSKSAEEALKMHPHLRAHRFVSYRFAGAPDRAQVLRGLAEATAGHVVTVAGHDEVAAAAEAHKSEGARLLSLTVPGAKHLVVVGDPVRLHGGQTLTVFGRANPGAQLELTIEEMGERRVQRFALGARQSQLVPLSWAAALVESWGSEGRARRSLSLQLAQHYRFAHEAAALILATVGGRTAVRIESLAAGLLQLREAEAVGASSRLQLSKDVQLALRELRIRFDGSGVPQTTLQWMPRTGGRERHRAERAYAALRDEPAFAHHFRMARTRAGVGDTLGAVRAVSTLAELAPLDEEGLRATAYALIGLGRPKTAAKVLHEVEKVGGLRSRQLLDLGIAYESAGRIAKAAELWELGFSRGDAFKQLFGRQLVAVYSRVDSKGLAALGKRQRWLERRFDPAEFQLTALVSSTDVSLDLVVVRGGSVCRLSRCAHGARVDAVGQGVMSYVGPGPGGPGLDVLVEHQGSGAWAPHEAAFVFLVERRGDQLRHSMRLLEHAGQAWLLTTLKAR